jgi:DNA-binding response OmpR family regulator
MKRNILLFCAGQVVIISSVKILVIEDEKNIANFVKDGLKSEGYAVDVSLNGEEGFYKADECDYDLIILDIMLPGMDGIEITKKLRAAGKSVPILILSARDAVEDRVKGLNAGADDYLVKPFSFDELLARVNAKLRKPKTKGTAKKLKVGDLIIDHDTREVVRGGKKIALSATEFKLITYLAQNTNKVVSRSMILENIWGYDFSPESNIVEVYIKYLRDKVDKGFKKELIHTVHGAGYRLCVPG